MCFKKSEIREAKRLTKYTCYCFKYVLIITKLAFHMKNSRKFDLEQLF